MNFHKEIERQRRRAKRAVQDFVEGAAAGDLHRMTDSFDALTAGAFDGGRWVRAMGKVARLGSVPLVTQEFFLQVFISHGDTIRQECEDLVLANGLRVLLPPYKGTAMQLFRGESFNNRRRRTYGLSWTASVDVARQFAESRVRRTGSGGTLLIEAFAPPEAIICAPALIDDRYAELEYIVDRRRLTSVNVMERFSQLSHDDLKLSRQT